MKPAIFDWVFKHRRLIQWLLALVVFLLVAYYLAVVNNILPLPYVSLSRIHLIVTPFAEIFILLVLLDIHRHYQANALLNPWTCLFFFLLINLGLVGYFYNYYSVQAVPDAASVYLVVAGAPYVFLALGVGLVVSFYFGMRGFVRRGWEGLTYEGGEIALHGKWITLLLTLLFLAGLGLRLYNLDGFPPYVDEYIHTNHAFSLYSGNGWDWDRAYLTVTWPVYLSFLGFGVNLWAARLPMILINMLAIFPLYGLGRRVNPAVGMICAALFSFSPWIIASSRTVRDYAIVPVFFYTAGLFLLEMLDWDSFNLVAYLKKHAYRILALGVILFYAVYDKTSILKVVVALYGIFALLVALRLLKRGLSRRFQVALIGVLGTVLVFLLFQSRLLNRYISFGIVSYDQTTRFWDALVSSVSHQWYVIGAIGYVILFLGLVGVLRAVFTPYRKDHFAVLFFFLAFLSLLVYLSFFLINTYIPERTRYGVLMQYWYLPVVAVGVWLLYKLIRSIPPRLPSALVILVLGILFSNPQSIQRVLTYQGGGTLIITGEKHYIVAPAHQFLVENLTEQDVLLTEFVHSYDTLVGQKLRFSEQVSYYSLVFRNDTSPLTLVEQYPRGWIALSRNARPEKNGLVFADFSYADQKVTYRGRFGEIYLWQWGE